MILYWRLIPQCLAGTPRRLRSYFHPCQIYWRSRRGGGCFFLYSLSVWPWGGSWPAVFWVVPYPRVSFWCREPVLALVWKYHQSLCSLKCPKTKHKWPLINELLVIWSKKRDSNLNCRNYCLHIYLSMKQNLWKFKPSNINETEEYHSVILGT